MLLQVFDNLLGNGLKFSPKNSSLIIRAYTWPDSCPAFPPSIKNDGAPQCELVSPLPKVRIEIADTGSGISQADQEKIFDCLLYTSPSPRDPKSSRMPSSA